MSPWPVTIAMCLLALPGGLGILALMRLRLGLNQLELFSYGFPLGVVVYSLLLLVGCSLAGLNGWSVGLPLTLCLVGAAFLLRGRVETDGAGGWSELLRGRSEAGGSDWARWMPLLILGALAARWIWFYSRLCIVDGEGLWITQVNVWADWARHYGDTASFVFSQNFPPGDPRYAGNPFAYHYLLALHAAAMVEVGLGLIPALPLQSLVLMLLLTTGLYSFFRRLTGDGSSASLALVLFFLAGGLGWWVLLTEPEVTSSGVAGMLEAPWNRAVLFESNVQFQNIFFSLLAPQRPLLLGLPLGLLTLTLLLLGIEQGRVAPFAVAGVTAGLLPFAHLGTLLALALVVPFLVVLFYSRRWWVFLGLWFIVGFPQFLLQQGGGRGVLESLRLQIGWLAGEEGWLRFWLDNLGAFVPLVIVSLLVRSILPTRSYRFLLALMPLFVIANLVVFQPWDWDNTKILMYWFLAGCALIAALLIRMWRAERGVLLSRTFVVLLAAVLMLSGLWEHLAQGLGHERNLFLTREELRLAETVRQQTAPRSVFAVGLKHNHPVPVLTGRQVLMSYPGWLWSHGIDYAERESDLRALYGLGEGAEEVLRKYSVDYVVVGPDEKAKLGADSDRFHSRYPVLPVGAAYEIFRVGSARGDSEGG